MTKPAASKPEIIELSYSVTQGLCLGEKTSEETEPVKYIEYSAFQDLQAKLDVAVEALETIGTAQYLIDIDKNGNIIDVIIVAREALAKIKGQA